MNICLMVRNVLCLTPWYTSLQAGPFWYSADMKNLIYQTCISWMKGLFLHFSSHPQQGGAGRKLCWWADRHGTVHEAPKHRKGGSSGIFDVAYPHRAYIKPSCSSRCYTGRVCFAGNPPASALHLYPAFVYSPLSEIRFSQLPCSFLLLPWLHSR